MSLTEAMGMTVDDQHITPRGIASDHLLTMEWSLFAIPDRPSATLTSDDPPFILQVLIFCKIIKIVVLPIVPIVLRKP